jgi:hypothetical protein
MGGSGEVALSLKLAKLRMSLAGQQISDEDDRWLAETPSPPSLSAGNLLRHNLKDIIDREL